MRLGAAIISLVPRLLIAVPVFAVVVCAAICAALIDALSPVRATLAADRGRHHELLL